MTDLHPRRYRPADMLTPTLLVLLTGHFVWELTALPLHFWTIQVLQTLIADQPISEDQLLVLDMVVGLHALTFLLLFLLTVIFYCIWIHRMNANARALGAAGMTFTPGWSAGWYFIPIASLWKPYQATQEIWRASSPDPDALHGESWQQTAGSVLVGWWWALWIISTFASQAAFRFWMRAEETLENMLISSYADVAVSLLELPTALLAIFMVRSLARRQQQRHAARMLAPATDEQPVVLPAY